MFFIMSLFGPVFTFYLYKKYSKNVTSKKFLMGLELYSFFSTIVLWMACFNYFYLRISSDVAGEEFDFLVSEYHKTFMYYIVISVCFAILGRSSLENNAFALFLFKDMKYVTISSLK